MFIDGVVEWNGMTLEGSGGVGGSAESDGLRNCVEGGAGERDGGEFLCGQP